MRPSREDRTVNIPITFSKRSEGAVSGKTLFWILLTATTLFIIFVIGILIGSKPWYIKIPLSLIFIYLYLFFIRFFVFREGRLSDAYETMIKEDYKLSTNSFWGIYDISKKPPYIVYYANGQKGIFVRFDKDVIVGKEDYMEYRHFEGISDMYNVAHTLGLNMVNVDYMDSVGNDPRMESVHAVASNVSNPDLKAILVSIYSNLDQEMALDYTSFDVYLFTTREREEDLWYNVRQVIEYGLKANYKSYSLINPEELRKMAQAIMNLEDFSLIEAEKEVIKSTLNTRIRPIKVIRSDGTTQIINKTSAELLMDQEKRRSEKQTNKKTGNKTNKDNKTGTGDLVDLFEATSALDKQWGMDEDDLIDSKNKNKKSEGSGKQTKGNQTKDDNFFDDDIF